MRTSRGHGPLRNWLRRGASVALAIATLSVAAPMAAGADTTTPVVNSVSVSGSDVSVQWTLNVNSPTSVDAILYDASGNVVADDTVDPSATTDTFYGVANASGYYVVITAGVAATTVASSPSDPVTVASDQSPYGVNVAANAGALSVTWSNGAPDATGVDVTLYDANSNVVETVSVASTDSAATLTNVPDATGYYVVVTAHTPSGDLSSDPSSSFDLVGGSLSNDGPVTLNDVSCSAGTVLVTWTSNASDATGYDVTLYDANANVVSTTSVDAASLSAGFTNVADASGYYVEIVAHTPAGDFSTDSWSFTIANGTIAQIPVDPPIILGGTGPIPVDPATVTVTPIDNGAGGWTVSWPELSDAPTNGYYLVTTDQGDSCSVDATGVAGTTLSCDLSPSADGSAPTGVVVNFESRVVPIDYFGSVMSDSAGSSAASSSPATTTSPVAEATMPRRFERGAHVVALPVVAAPRADSSPWALEGAVLALVVAALCATTLSRRRQRI